MNTNNEHFNFSNSIPVAPLKIIAMESIKDLGAKIDSTIRQIRTERENSNKTNLHFNGYLPETFLVKSCCPRFGSGEAKGIISESIRGTDLFIMTDVCNYGLTYTVSGFTNHMSPDDHFQDLKRIISATNKHAHRITVIMPFLYESRQHKRTKLESLDCALALEELVDMGVSNIITFDAHDPRISNSIPLYEFENFQPPFQFIKAITDDIPDIKIDKDSLMIISPDEGAMSRAVYFANVLGVDMGMFYKRRDYSTIINGKNPIVAHEFLGTELKGKDVIIVDDMISSGESMLDTAKELKQRGAARVFICTTFGLFTDGLDKFDEYFAKEYITRVIVTNLNYTRPEVDDRSYILKADMTRYLSTIIDTFNHDISTKKVVDPTLRIRDLVEEYNKRGLNV